MLESIAVLREEIFLEYCLNSIYRNSTYFCTIFQKKKIVIIVWNYLEVLLILTQN